MEGQGWHPLCTSTNRRIAAVRNLLKVVIFTLFFALWPRSALCRENLRDPRFVAQAQAGFALSFNLDYDDAIRTFARLRSEYPKNPAPSLYMASTIWLRELVEREDLDLNKFVSPAYFDQPAKQAMPRAERQEFMDLIDESRRLAQAILAQNPGDNDAQYFLASSYGISAAFAITVDHN